MKTLVNSGGFCCLREVRNGLANLNDAGTVHILEGDEKRKLYFAEQKSLGNRYPLITG